MTYSRASPWPWPPSSPLPPMKSGNIFPGSGRPESVHLASFPSPPPGFPDEALLAKYDFLLKVRGEINRSLEEARKEKRLATAQEAAVILATMDGQLYDKLKSPGGGAQNPGPGGGTRGGTPTPGGPGISRDSGVAGYRAAGGGGEMHPLLVPLSRGGGRSPASPGVRPLPPGPGGIRRAPQVSLFSW